MANFNGAGLGTPMTRSTTYLVSGTNTALADGTEASGQIIFPVASSIVDNEIVTLDDGINAPVTFELNKTGAATAGLIEVDLSSATTADDVGAAFETAVNGVTTALRLTASNASGTVTITNDVSGSQGNVTTWTSDNATILAAITQPTGGAGLIPASGHTLGIASGQLGVISRGKGGIVPDGEFLTAGQTKAEAPVIQIIQGTPNSADISAVGPQQFRDKAYVASAPINSAYPVGFASTVCSGGNYSSFILGAADGTAGNIPETDNANYTLNITLDGVRQNRYFGTSGFRAINADFTSLDYTTLAATYPDPRGHIVENMVYRINLNSKIVEHSAGLYGGADPIVAFAINTSGGSGTTLTAASGLANGTAIPFATMNGVTQNFIVDDAFKAAVSAWIATTGHNVDGDSTIENVDLSTAGTGSGTASDVIIVMALDEGVAEVRNDLKPVKVRLRVGAEGAFLPTTLAKTEATYAVEREGTGERLAIEYGMLAQHQIHSQQKWGYNKSLIEAPSYISTTASYTQYVIDHMDEHYVVHSHTSKHPHRTIILVECSEATGTGQANVVSSLNSILAPWLNSCTLESTTANPVVFA